MSTAIEVRDLVKVYPGGTRAVDGLTFDVPAGEIFGLLGPNGSGKTTTVRILVTLLRHTSGTARVGGFDVRDQPREVRRLLGYAGQFVGVDEDLTARENLILQGRLHGLPAAEAARRTAELLDLMALTEIADLRTSRYSGGMRRRVDLVQALVHRPSILFLDEPTTGMDPQSRMALWQYLEKLKRDGVTIFLTTQYLEEADRACDRVAIIDSGRILRLGSPAALKEELGADRVTLTLSSPVTEDHYDRAARVVATFPELAQVERVEPLTLSVADAGGSLPRILRRIEAEGIRIVSFRSAQVTLDDVFLRYTGHKVRADVNIEHAVSTAVASVHGKRAGH